MAPTKAGQTSVRSFRRAFFSRPAPWRPMLWHCQSEHPRPWIESVDRSQCEPNTVGRPHREKRSNTVGPRCNTRHIGPVESRSRARTLGSRLSVWHEDLRLDPLVLGHAVAQIQRSSPKNRSRPHLLFCGPPWLWRSPPTSLWHLSKVDAARCLRFPRRGDAGAATAPPAAKSCDPRGAPDGPGPHMGRQDRRTPSDPQARRSCCATS